MFSRLLIHQHAWNNAAKGRGRVDDCIQVASREKTMPLVTIYWAEEERGEHVDEDENSEMTRMRNLASL